MRDFALGLSLKQLGRNRPFITFSSCPFISAACATLADEEKTFKVGDIEVKVKGKSGKMMIYRSFNVSDKKNSSKVMVKRNRVTLLMDAIQEIDSDGNIVGKSGKEKHSFNNFANQDFTFSPLTQTKLQNISAHTVTFTATNIGGTGGTLKVVIYLFSEDGEISVGNETDEVSKGSFKFSIEVGVPCTLEVMINNE